MNTIMKGGVARSCWLCTFDEIRAWRLIRAITDIDSRAQFKLTVESSARTQPEGKCAPESRRIESCVGVVSSRIRAVIAAGRHRACTSPEINRDQARVPR